MSLRRKIDEFMGALTQRFVDQTTEALRESEVFGKIIGECDPKKVEYLVLLALNYSTKRMLKNHKYSKHHTVGIPQREAISGLMHQNIAAGGIYSKKGK
jgi:hypothetical protein